MNRIALLTLLCFALGARAETNEIRAAQQYGLSYLALMLMEDGKLVEKHAKAMDGILDSLKENS